MKSIVFFLNFCPEKYFFIYHKNLNKSNVLPFFNKTKQFDCLGNHETKIKTLCSL